METQFTYYRKSAKIRIIFAVLLSLFVHAGLVAFAAFRPDFGKKPPAPPEVVEEVNLDPPPPELVVPEDYVPEETPPEPTPPEDETPEPEETPPPVEDMTFAEPTPEPTPEKPKPPAKRPPPGFVPPPNAKRGPAFVPGVVGGVPGGVQGGKVGGQGWRTPKPPYPAVARQMRAQGETVVSISTDASGNVKDVTIVKSAGALLDGNTKNSVRANWKGPPNATKQVTFSYEMR